MAVLDQKQGKLCDNFKYYNLSSISQEVDVLPIQQVNTPVAAN